MPTDRTPLPSRFATERALHEAVASLAGRGMRPADIAKHLGIANEWVTHSRRTEPLDELNRWDDGSFPASDPPVSPSA